MRIVILSSSLYSETACALAVHLVDAGHAPVGALALRTFDHRTLFRKLGQWGVGGMARYARGKIIPPRAGGPLVSNPCLQPFLVRGDRVFRGLRQVAAAHAFPVVTCNDHNDPSSVSQLKAWAPDLMIFAGGNILRKPLLQLPRLGVLNVHLGWLPEVRGMSSPEWSLLRNVTVGITIHFMDSGIDTGPVLQKYELPAPGRSDTLTDLRNRLIAFGVEKVAEIVVALDQERITAKPQPHPERDSQFFVMHEWLRERAARRLGTISAPAETVHG